MQQADLFMFMGQSNMAGRGITSARWPQTAPALSDGAGWEFRALSDPSKLYPIAEPFGVNENDPNGIHENMKTGSMVTAFANVYYQETGVPVLGISASKGGSSILEWQPGGAYLSDACRRFSAADRDYVWDGSKYIPADTNAADSMKKTAESAGAAAQPESPDVQKCRRIQLRHRYMLWCQGETDGDHGMSGADYQMYFKRMLAQMRSAGIEHCFLVRIGLYNGTGSQDYAEIIAAQEELARSCPDVTMVSRSFSEMKARGLMKDEFHYYQQAYNEVGTEAGKAAAQWVLAHTL